MCLSYAFNIGRDNAKTLPSTELPKQVLNENENGPTRQECADITNSPQQCQIPGASTGNTTSNTSKSSCFAATALTERR